jgi:hypothetical protein
MNVKFTRYYNFEAPDVQFDKLCLISDAQAKTTRNAKCYDCIDP